MEEKKQNPEEEIRNTDGTETESRKEAGDEGRKTDTVNHRVGIALVLIVLGIAVFNMDRPRPLGGISIGFNQSQRADGKSEPVVTVYQNSNGETNVVYRSGQSRKSYPADELVESYHRMGYYEEAAACAESAEYDIEHGNMESAIRGAWIRALLGDSFLELGKYEAGKEFIDRAVRGYQEAGETGENYDYVYYLQGKYCLKTEQYEDAVTYMEQALEYVDDSGNRTTWEELREARIYCDAGAAYRRLDDLDRAELYLKKAYGIANERMLESEIACEYYKKVLEPEIWELYLASSGESVDGENGGEVTGEVTGEAGEEVADEGGREAGGEAAVEGGKEAGGEVTGEATGEAGGEVADEGGGEAGGEAAGEDTGEMDGDTAYGQWFAERFGDES